MGATPSQANIETNEQNVPLTKKTFFSWFKEMFIFFWITSLIGHYWEVIWAVFKHNILGEAYFGPAKVTITPIAAPYGLGALVIILFVLPLMKKYKLNPLAVCVLNIFIAGLVEYVCAAVLVLIFGANHFWNYSNEMFNLNGFICLRNTLAFGILSTLYVYYLHPILLNFLRKLTAKNYNVLFWTMFLSYAIDLTYASLR